MTRQQIESEIQKKVDDYLKQLNGLADAILEISGKGDEVAQNDSQRLFFSVVRDCAFKIKQELKRVQGEY